MKTFFKLMPLVFVLALAGCAQNYEEESAEFSEILAAVDVPYADHEMTTYDVLYRESYENAPVVVMVHGGFQDEVEAGNVTKQGMRADAATYTSIGFVAMAMDYRWSEAPFGVAAHDIACAIASFRENAEKYGADPNNIMIHGHSGGASKSAQLYFRQDYDWLKACPVSGPPLAFKGYVNKASAAFGFPLPEGITGLEHEEDGIRIVATQEVLEDPLVQEYISSSELTVEPGHVIFDGPINHLESSDGSMLVVYGDEDPFVGRNIDSLHQFLERMEDAGLDYKEVVLPGVGHRFAVGGRTKSKNAIQKYALSVANNEPFPF